MFTISFHCLRQHHCFAELFTFHRARRQLIAFIRHLDRRCINVAKKSDRVCELVSELMQWWAQMTSIYTFDLQITTHQHPTTNVRKVANSLEDAWSFYNRTFLSVLYLQSGARYCDVTRDVVWR